MSKIAWIGLGVGIIVGFIFGSMASEAVLASIYDVLGGEEKILAEISLDESWSEEKEKIKEESKNEVQEANNKGLREEIRQVIREEMWPLLASRLSAEEIKSESVQARTEAPVFNLSLDIGGLTLKTDGEGLINYTSGGEGIDLSGEGWCEIREDKPAGGGVKISEVAWMGNGKLSNSEWLELKNTSGSRMELGGWQLVSRDGGIKIEFSEGEVIEGRGNYLIERGSDDTLPEKQADFIYTGALSNLGEDLFLFDTTCEIEDEILAARGWPAGETDLAKTMERSFGDMNWYDSLISGGTPRENNSIEITGGEIVSTVTEAEEEVITGGVRLNEVQMGSEANAKDEFVELVNESGEIIDLTGWSLTKLSSSGSESSLAVAARFEGKSVPIAGHFLITRDGGYDGTVVADIKWPSSYGLAYSENSVILYDDTGSEIDRVSWVSVPAGKSYERTGSGWQLTNTPNPENSGM